MNKNVFITGGTGQDGQILAILLKNKRINLTILYKSKKPKNKKSIYYIKNNLLNKKKIDLIFKKKKPDIVLHLAANNPSFIENNYKIFFKKIFLLPKIFLIRHFKLIKKQDLYFVALHKYLKKKLE